MDKKRDRDRNKEQYRSRIYDPQIDRDYDISGITSIGRNRESNQIPLGIGEDGKRTEDLKLRNLLLRISKNHALIIPSKSSDGRYKVVDIGDTNGTYVEKDGEFVLVDNRGVRLRNNDKIYLGGDPNIEKTYTLVFKQEGKKGNKNLDDLASGTVLGIFSILSFIFGFIFLYGNLTGNVISNFTNQTSNIVSVTLFVIGIIGSYFWFKKK